MIRATRPTPEDLQADLTFLRDMFPRVDRSFTAQTAAVFAERVDAALARVAVLSEGEFAMAVAHAIAAADNAHTMPILHQWLRVAPVRLHWFSDGMYAIRSAAGPPELVGARILAIAGHAPEEWLARLHDYIGGTSVRRRVLSAFYLSSAEALSAIEPAASPDSLAIAFVDRGGRQHSCRLENASLDANTVLYPRIDANLGRVPPSDTLSWRQSLDALEHVPLYLRDPERPVVHEWLGDTLHVGLRRLQNADDLELKPYLARVIEEARSRRVRHAIVDLRFNDGGDFTLARKFAQQLPSTLRDDGRLWIVTNSETFSAGLIVVALLKYYGGARATIVGEPASDRPVFWADGGVFELPRTELPVRCATALHDWERGCQDATRGAWFNLLYSVPAGSLEPSIAVPLSFDDYASGRDPVLPAILGRPGEGPRP
jgi:hypothetical protein